MHYEINVALNGRHFFGTHERSIRDESQAKKILHIFMEKFPKTEGYSVSIVEYRETVKDVTDLLKGIE